MPLIDWTNLMGLPETSSGGPSLLNSEKLWELETSKGLIESGESIVVSFSATLDHLETTRTMFVEGRDEYALARFLCCALIAKLPNEGVDECLATVNDIYQFYTVSPSKLLPTPTIEKLSVAIANTA